MTTAIVSYQIVLWMNFHVAVANDQVNKKIQNIQNKQKRSNHCNNRYSKDFKFFYVIQYLIKKAEQEKGTRVKFQIFQLQTNQTDLVRFH